MKATQRPPRPAGTGAFALALLAGGLACSAWAAGGGPASPAGVTPAPAAASASAMPVAMPAAQAVSLPKAPTPTRQALETLLGSLPEVADASGAPRARAVAGRNETVDAAVRRTLGDLPFKESFLRGVFLELNAAAVQPGTMRLVAGAPLQVPNVADLRAHLQRALGTSPGAAAHAAAQAHPAAAPGANVPGDRRAWVRFP